MREVIQSKENPEVFDVYKNGEYRGSYTKVENDTFAYRVKNTPNGPYLYERLYDENSCVVYLCLEPLDILT